MSGFIRGKAYPIIKEASKGSDEKAQIAKEALECQRDENRSQSELNSILDRFFQSKGAPERPREGHTFKKGDKGLMYEAFENALKANDPDWRKKFDDEVRKQAGDEAQAVMEYLKKNDEFTDWATKQFGKKKPTISKENIDRAVKFFYDNPNWDITGKMGGRENITKGKECLIIIGPAGSGKTYFASNDKQYGKFVETAVSIDPDKYRNADPRYAGIIGLDSTQGDPDTSKMSDEELIKSYNLEQNKKGKWVERTNWDNQNKQVDPNRKGHDYRWSTATQGTQQKILGKYDDPNTLFGREVAEGNNFVYQTVGDGSSKVLEMCEKLNSMGWKVHLVQNQIEGGVKRLASNTIDRYKHGAGRMVPPSVSMAGLQSTMTFAQCVRKFKGKKNNISLEMNLVRGESFEEQKGLIEQGAGSDKLNYGNDVQKRK